MKSFLMLAAGLALTLPLTAPGLAQTNTTATAHSTAPRCRDAHGHFTHCPPAGAAVHTTNSVTRDSRGRCHGANGHFVACPH